MNFLLSLVFIDFRLFFYEIDESHVLELLISICDCFRIG